MSRNTNKKPVGFATHIIAGGMAGGCEAVSRILPVSSFGEVTDIGRIAHMSAARHYQGPHAVVQVWAGSRGKLRSRLRFPIARGDSSD